MGSHITTYTPELAIRICEGIAEWGSVNKALEAVKGAPSRNTWYRWLLLYPDLKAAQDRARELSAQSMEDTMLEKVEELLDKSIDIPKALLDRYNSALQQLRWSATRRDPRLYGEKSDLRIVVPIQIITDLNLGQDGAKVVNSENIYEVHAIEAAPAVTTEDTPDGVEDAEVADRPLTPREELASQYVVPAFGATSPVRANTGVKGKPGRPRKGHKTPAQLRVTMAAYGNRKKPLGGSGGTA
jgi:hypothetical protein